MTSMWSEKVLPKTNSSTGTFTWQIEEKVGLWRRRISIRIVKWLRVCTLRRSDLCTFGVVVRLTTVFVGSMKEEKHLIFFTEGMNLEHDRSMIVTKDRAGDPFCRHAIVTIKMQTPCSQDRVEDGVLISDVVIRTTAAEESQHEVGSTLKSERICKIHHQNHVKNQKCGVFIL